MFSWLRRRDAAIYPADELGDALYERFPSPDKMPDMALLWYDVYFDAEADADALARYCEQRRLEINRDCDEDIDDGLGPWNVDVSFPVKARHLHLKAQHAEALQRIAEHRGKLGTWLLLPADER